MPFFAPVKLVTQNEHTHAVFNNAQPTEAVPPLCGQALIIIQKSQLRGDSFGIHVVSLYELPIRINHRIGNFSTIISRLSNTIKIF